MAKLENLQRLGDCLASGADGASFATDGDDEDVNKVPNAPGRRYAHVKLAYERYDLRGKSISCRSRVGKDNG
jgi:hypothetical protein